MRYFLVVLMIIASISAAAEQPRDVVLDPGISRGVMLSIEHMEYLAADQDLSWNDVRSREMQAWERPPVDTVGRWAPDHAQWIRFPVRNVGQRSGTFWLEIRWPLLRDIEMRALRDGEFGEAYQAGSAYPKTDGEVVNKSIVFPVSLQRDESATVYLRIVDPSFLYLPMFVWSEQAYGQHSDIRLIIFSMALGILLVMTLYNASLYLFTRDVMYLVYSNSVFSTLLFSLAITGLGSLLVWGEHPWFVSNAYPVFSSYCFLSVTYFFRVFVELKRHGGWVLKLNNFILLMWSLVLVGNLLGFHQLAMGLSGLMGVVATLVGLVSALYLWTRGSQAGKYFSIAWAPICIATIYSILAIFGLVGYYPGLEYMHTLSFVAEVVVLSIALADRINREREAREQAQALALEQQRSIVQLKEKANTELEEQVDVRTRELQSVLSELGHANEELAELTKTDPLTKLSNRRHFDEAAALELSRAIRSELPLTIMVIDIDYFKTVNDSYGHIAGDKCLKAVAKAITQVVGRETDVVARYGGEEFAVILPDTEETAARLVAEHIRTSIQGIDFIYEGQIIPVTASVGVVSTNVASGCDVDRLVNAADKALYLAKQNGRNRVESGTIAEQTSGAQAF